MLRRAVVLALLAGPALAESDIRWGMPLERTGWPNELRITRCEDATCFAQVTFRNSQLRGMALTRSFALHLDGLSVNVTVVDGALRDPEQVVVTAPPGFYAEPSSLMVEEDTAGTVRIVAMPMS